MRSRKRKLETDDSVNDVSRKGGKNKIDFALLTRKTVHKLNHRQGEFMSRRGHVGLPATRSSAVEVEAALHEAKLDFNSSRVEDVPSRPLGSAALRIMSTKQRAMLAKVERARHRRSQHVARLRASLGEQTILESIGVTSGF